MSLFHPIELTTDVLLGLGAKVYGEELTITGVPTNASGAVVWESMEDLVTHPHAHGLLTSIETVSHVHQWVSMTVEEMRSTLPRLKVRFAATIDEVIDGQPETHNPAVWIHLGHGQLEHSIELLEGDEEWEEEDYERVPGLSNGHEDEDYRSARDIANRIARQQGNILFMALPLCYGQQVAKSLCRSGRIDLVHAPTTFPVCDGLQFYDGVDHTERTRQSLAGWSEWVKAVEKAWRGAARVLLLGRTP